MYFSRHCGRNSKKAVQVFIMCPREDYQRARKILGELFGHRCLIVRAMLDNTDPRAVGQNPEFSWLMLMNRIVNQMLRKNWNIWTTSIPSIILGLRCLWYLVLCPRMSLAGQVEGRGFAVCVDLRYHRLACMWFIKVTFGKYENESPIRVRSIRLGIKN